MPSGAEVSSNISHTSSYNDPIIDQIRTARSDTRKTFRQVHEKSGVSVATIRNWEHGKTRRPQFATVMAVINALGKSLVTKNGKPFIVG